MIQLPYLKNRLPRIEQEPPEDTLVKAKPADLIDFHCAMELMHAFQDKSVERFRVALEALVINLLNELNELNENGEFDAPNHGKISKVI